MRSSRSVSPSQTMFGQSREWDGVMAEHADINVAINFAGESAASGALL